MSAPHCPGGGERIAGEDFNVAKEVADGRGGHRGHQLSDLVHGLAWLAGVEWHRPPAGARFSEDGRGTIIGATPRSLAGAVGLLASALFWNGLVAVFRWVVRAATVRHLNLPLPDWLPAPKMNGDDLGVGRTIFRWIFLTPFLLVGLGLMGGFLSGLAGRTEVRIQNKAGEVCTGIGPLGWRRRFDASAVKEVRLDDRHWRDRDGDQQHRASIVLETRPGRRIKFGPLRTEARRKFVAAAVRRVLFH